MFDEKDMYAKAKFIADYCEAEFKENMAKIFEKGQLEGLPWEITLGALYATTSALETSLESMLKAKGLPFMPPEMKARY